MQVACSLALSTHHSALAKAEEARKCCEELKGAKEQLRGAHVVTSTAHDGAKTAKEEAFMFEADYVAEAERGRDEVSEFAKRSRE